MGRHYRHLPLWQNNRAYVCLGMDGLNYIPHINPWDTKLGDKLTPPRANGLKEVMFRRMKHRRRTLKEGRRPLPEQRMWHNGYWIPRTDAMLDIDERSLSGGSWSFVEDYMRLVREGIPGATFHHPFGPPPIKSYPMEINFDLAHDDSVTATAFAAESLVDRLRYQVKKQGDIIDTYRKDNAALEREVSRLSGALRYNKQRVKDLEEIIQEQNEDYSRLQSVHEEAKHYVRKYERETAERNSRMAHHQKVLDIAKSAAEQWQKVSGSSDPMDFVQFHAACNVPGLASYVLGLIERLATERKI